MKFGTDEELRAIISFCLLGKYEISRSEIFPEVYYWNGAGSERRVDFPTIYFTKKQVAKWGIEA